MPMQVLSEKKAYLCNQELYKIYKNKENMAEINPSKTIIVTYDMYTVLDGVK